MPRLVKAGQTDFTKARVFFHLVGPDGITPATGESGGQPQWANNGGAWLTINFGTLVSIGNGRYYAEFTSAAAFVAGKQIVTRYKSANTAECPGSELQIVGFDPDLLEQEIARADRPFKTVWFVRTDGSDANDGLSPFAAKLSPKTTIEAAAAGDLVVLGAGTFALGAAVVNVPAGVSVVGAGRDATVLTSTADLPGTGCIVRPGTEALISDLTIWGTLTNGISQACLGYFIRSGLNQPAFTNAEARRLRLIADSDGIYLNNALSATHVSSLRCYDVIVETKYDCVFHSWGAGVLDLYDCHLRSVGPSASGDGITAGIAARAGLPSASTPVTRMYRGSISVEGGTVQNSGVESNMAGGRIELYDVSVRSAGTGAKDVLQQLGAVVAGRVAYDPAKVTGTVTIVPAANLSADERGAAADKYLYRSLVGGADGVQGDRIVLEALRPGRNKVLFDVPAPGQFTVFKENDTDPAWVGTYTRAANTVGPLVGVDPA